MHTSKVVIKYKDVWNNTITSILILHMKDKDAYLVLKYN